SRPQSEFATIIWFHPGDFVTGTPTIWNPHTLVYRHRVIVVTVAWRLNVLGFFTTMDSAAPGNYGLMDQQAAMLWVKKNIGLFGGNPDNICLMGYGAGATSIGLHMTNPISRGLFNKAIAMSGNYLSPSVARLPKDYKEHIDAIIPEHCEKTPSSKLVECLRNTKASWLVDQAANIDWSPLLDAGLGNTSFLQDLPINSFERGEYSQIPLLTGYTHMEKVLEIDGLSNVTDFSSAKLRELLEKKVAAATYLQASYLTKENSTYVYRFHIKLSTKAARGILPEWITVPHLYDLIYVWGVPYWENTGIDWDIRDRKFSDTVMSLWTTFAKSSDPSENNIYPIEWAPFNEDNPGIMIIDDTFNMNNSNNVSYKAFDFWNHYYPKVKEMAVKCCELTASGNSLRNNWP
ncbi:hypothetical protein NQ318_015847, partial [Aromia moschata]